MVAVPADTPLIPPVVEFIVATELFEDDHVPPFTVELNVVEPPTQMACVPLNVPALGGAVTVTACCFDGVPPQPPVIV